MSSFEPMAMEQLLAGNADSLRQLLSSRFPAPETYQSLLTTDQLIEQLSALPACKETHLIEALAESLPPEQGINASDYAVLYFVDLLFARHAQDNQLADSINHCIKPLHALVAIEMLNDASWLWDSQQPLQRYLQMIQKNCQGWDNQQGTSGERFLAKLSDSIAQLQQSFNHDAQQSSLVALQTFFDQENNKRKRLQKRICESEQATFKARHAQQLATKILNRKMAGKKLPQPIVSFLQQYWLETLRLQLLKLGEASSQWNELLDVTDLLIGSFQPGTDYDQLRYEAIETLPKRLQKTAISINQQPDLLQDQLAKIEAEHLIFLKGQTPTYCEFDLVENTHPLHSNQIHTSRGLLKQIDHLQPGQWFIDFNETEQTQRVQLIQKLESEQQLLFGFFAGAKTLHYNYEEFAYRLTSQHTFILQSDQSISNTAKKLLESLLKLHNQQQEKQAKEDKEQARQRELAQEKARTEAKALAEQERQRLEQEQRVAEEAAQQQLKEQQQRDAEKVRLGTEQFKRMNVGALIDFKLDAGNQTLKLAVKLKSTGRHIFTDKAGIKKLDLSQDELLAMFINQQACIVQLGEEFENSLSKIVDGIRNNKR